MPKTTQTNRASTAPDQLGTGPAGHDVTSEERQAAAATWLLSAADNREIAKQEWSFNDVALLRCGTLFTAVRVPLATIVAAAGTDDLRKLGAYLNEVLLGGAVFLNRPFEDVYFLVPPSTWGGWSVPDTDCLCPGVLLGVPRPGAEPTERSHWLVEMDGPGVLCMTEPVMRVVTSGRLRIAQNDD
ncbi:hypothetical protein ACFY64_32185 [Streptomyces collinus]|uniref:hypothetical protein n=1 Tax=Streptomyces collinus TaxID=42684 RepID=UPI0036C9780C